MEPLTLFGLGTNIMFSLGIIFAIVFIIFYMRQRFSDYNHKLNSMFQLISAMADELNKIKQSNQPINENETIEDNNELLKLVVSDDEGDDSDSDTDSDDSDDEDNTDTVDYDNIVINNDLENVIVKEVSNDLANQSLEENDIKIIELNTDLEEQVEINKLNVKQLKDLATQKGLSFDKAAKKNDLIKLLEENEN